MSKLIPNPAPPLFSLPYITVSAKGVANGLSTEYNDGADFGPDTMLGTTSKDQYGPPYTQTAGIQEAWNYAISKVISYPSGSVRNNFIPKIVLEYGIFYVSQPIILTAPFVVNNLNFEGQGMMPTYVGTTSDFPTTGNMITIDPNILNYLNFTFKDMQFFGNCNIYLHADFSNANASTNVAQLENIDIAQPNNGTYSVYFNALQSLYANNFQDYSTEGAYFNGTNGRSAYISSVYPTVNALSISGFSNVDIVMGTNGEQINSHTGLYNGGLTLTLSDLFNVNIGIYKPSATMGIYVNGNIHNLDIRQLISSASPTSPDTTLFDTQSSTAVTIENLHIGILDVNNNTNLTFSGSSLINFNSIDIDILNVENGSTLLSYPLQSITNGTTAGTVKMYFTTYTPSYKKLFIVLNGYENDTSTDQQISFPLPFAQFYGITNYTNSTLSLDGSSIIISASDSTSTYNGIAIVEGY
jgi:hypothetical protein